MRGKDFLDKMSLKDPRYVEEAEKTQKKKKSVWVKSGVLAACLCLLIGGIYLIDGKVKPDLPEFRSGDVITIPELHKVGAGFEGCLAYDVSELENGNPWHEGMDIKELPVYTNGAYDASGAGVPKGLSEEEMKERLKRFATALDFEAESISAEKAVGQVEGNVEAAQAQIPVSVRAETARGELTAFADGRVDCIMSADGEELPAEYNFTHYQTTDEEAKDVLDYFIDSYDVLKLYGDPVGISFGDYDVYGSFQRKYTVYDGAGDDVKDILNYNFRRSQFFPNEKGNLWIIRIHDDLLNAQKIGDYPIISTDEAKERLVRGNYQTSVPTEFPGEEFIGGVELIYRSGCFEEVFLPYYRFYVLLPEEKNEEHSGKKMEFHRTKALRRTELIMFRRFMKSTSPICRPMTAGSTEIGNPERRGKQESFPIRYEKIEKVFVSI